MSNKLNIFLASLLIIAGCGSESAKDHRTVTVWHWMSDREEAFVELAEQYRQLTGQKIAFDLYAPSESYSSKIKAAAQTNTLPDIFGVLGESRDLASFIRSGFVAELSGIIDKVDTGFFQDTLFEKAVSVNKFVADNHYKVEPGIYGVPLDITTIQMVYNRKLFRQAGLNPDMPPKTWDEFMDAARRLKDRKIPVFVGGFGEIWMLDALSSNWAMNIMGEEKVFDTYRGKVPYTDPDWVKVLGLFKQMTDEGIFTSGAVTMVNKSAEQAFANERAAIGYNGSWCVNVYKGMNPDLDYAAMLPPAISAENPMKIWGGAGSSFMVNNKSERKEAAIRFLRWLSEKEQQAFLANATNNLPANRHSLKNIAPILSQFADDIDNAVHPNNYPVHEAHLVTEAFAKGIQSIMIGEKTPEEVAAHVQEVKERETAKGF